MEYIIDRFEDNFVICEDENRKIIEIKTCDIPKNAKEGDVLELIDGKFVIDIKKTNTRREKNFSLLNKLLDK